MAYSTDIADLLTRQLSKFVTLNRHQLAGHVANLDFWLEEVAHAVAVLDGYDARFECMKNAQQRHVARHKTVELDRWDYEHGKPPSPPKHVPDAALGRAKRALCSTAHRFLTRCLDERFIDRERADLAHERLGIDPADFRRP